MSGDGPTTRYGYFHIKASAEPGHRSSQLILGDLCSVLHRQRPFHLMVKGLNARLRFGYLHLQVLGILLDGYCVLPGHLSPITGDLGLLHQSLQTTDLLRGQT